MPKLTNQQIESIKKTYPISLMRIGAFVMFGNTEHVDLIANEILELEGLIDAT